MPLSRISKLFVDHDQSAPADALARRQAYAVTLKCGADVASSYTLQLAVLTAANIASRCFPGAVRVALSDGVRDAPLLLWPWMRRTFGEQLWNLVGLGALLGPDAAVTSGRTIVFGDASADNSALRVTFDGWIAQVGPHRQMPRMAERQFCSLTGVLGAALAMSETFLAFADITLAACRRTLGLSLWCPSAPLDDPGALGRPIEYLCLPKIKSEHIGDGGHRALELRRCGRCD
jgi:hypothetical protein